LVHIPRAEWFTGAQNTELVAKVTAISNTEFDQNTLSGWGGGGGGGERVAGREAEGATRGR
jgi:hypothetical protein